MKGGKSKTKSRQAVPEKDSAVPVLKVAKAKSKNRLVEHPDPASLKSGIFSEEILPAILASIKDVIWSIDADTYETLYLNPAAERIYGRPASAFYADPKLFMNIVHPEDLPRVAQMARELIKKGAMTVQYRIIRPDGEVRWLEDNMAVARRADGRPVRFDGVATDITEARLSQSMLEKREARLRSVLETAPDPIVTIDEQGIIQSFSSAAEKLLGYSPAEIVGHNVNLLMPPPHREKHDDCIARYLATGGKHIIGIGRQVEAQRKDGAVFPIDLAVGEVESGGTYIFTGFIKDLMARVRMEQELRQAQKMEAMGQLTGGVAHDFNNLLTVISGTLEMLERRLTDAEQREILNEAQEASKLGAELTNWLLAFGRHQSLNPKPTDLNALAPDMATLSRRSLGESVETTLRLSEQLPLVMVEWSVNYETLMRAACG
jgi:PAS domain S-box-containing protein